jgi:predicted ATP pyrophosphatase (TIGR00289 family)
MVGTKNRVEDQERRPRVKVAILYSGGKDSNRALHWALTRNFDVAYLVTMFPRTKDSLMYHTPALNLVELQSQAVGIPLVKGQTTGVTVEEEVDSLRTTLKSLDIEGVVTGALESVYQKSRVDFVCETLGLRAYAPFWHCDLKKYLGEIIALGFETIFVGVAALGLTENWLGRRLDHEALKDLLELHKKYKINIGGEGGEYETLVCDGPTFRCRIQLLNTKRIWDKKSDNGYLEIVHAELFQKDDVGPSIVDPRRRTPSGHSVRL